MVESFFFIGLPYVAIVLMVVVSVYRFRNKQFTYSALSSQFLESKWLLWGSIPWHIGILVIFMGHVIPFLIPGVWQALVSNGVFLLFVEVLGIIAAMLCLAGLVVLFVRRVALARIQAVTTPADLAVLGLLIAQVLLGMSVAASHRWGSIWSTHTTTPYLWSLLTFQPRAELVTELPPVVRVHLVMAWFIFLFLPFSRLVHLFSVPFGYLLRVPQKVVWTNPRRFVQVAPVIRRAEESRRYFIRGTAGMAGAGLLLSVGVLDKLAQFLKGPSMTPEAEAELLTKKRQRLELTAKERGLEIERMKNDYIFVARLGHLSPKDGQYFTDYQMRPALAFRDQSGLPILISAKCTHLGCTVASTLNTNGQLLCPCHISYFDVHTGAPNQGSPATAPLPRLGWALMDGAGKVVATQGPDGVLEGKADMAVLDTYSVYIAKQFEEMA